MNKLLAVFKREYIQAVRKKMFIVMTFLMPVLMVGLFFIPSLMMERGMGVKKIAVLDATGQLGEAVRNSASPDEKGDIEVGEARRDLPGQIQTSYVDVRGQDLDTAAKPYFARMNADKDQRLDGVFLIPANALTAGDAKLRYYSRSATDFVTQARLSSRVNRSVQHHRLAQRGIPPADSDVLLKDLDVEAVQLSKSGEQKKGGVANFIVGFMLTGLLLVPSFVYGLEIMRGIIQEKTDRVVEVLVSSMTPAQLLVGKILGVAAVGLTQVGVWLALAAIAGTFGATTAALAGENFVQFLRPSTFVYFVIFFLLAYLTYVCVYAIGGAVCNSEKEAQQMIMPATMIMMLPWFLMAGIITNPDSSLSVGFSLAPVFGPLTMYVRTLVAEPPMWHILVSILVSLATIAAFFWITAKIFRVGILSYGKRPTLPELWRWIKVA
jgi:ABC-2 type transport system permease protein